MITPSLTAKILSSFRNLARHLRVLRNALHLGRALLSKLLKNSVPKLLSNPQVSDILRFIFLGSVVETTRLATEKAADFVRHFFIVKASFTHGDFAFDWVKRYLEDLHVWDHSRIFRVAARNPAFCRGTTAVLGDDIQANDKQDINDGRPHPIYQPATQEYELFRWRGRWISVSVDRGSTSEEGRDGIQALSLSVWSRNRKILDDFVQDARTHYFNSPLPPRKLFTLPDGSGSLLSVRFSQGDASFDWMIAFLRVQQGCEEDIMSLEGTTHQSDLSLRSSPGHPCERPVVAFKPSPHIKQRLKWNGHWVQFDVEPSTFSGHGMSYGGSVMVTIHNAKRSVFEELVLAAREEYLKSTVSKVTVHLADYHSWTRCITKNRRALNTLILPEGVKEGLLKDLREFLESEEWYVWAGVPHRRGYLLYGAPGTGKSSTVHALASELGLEIYYIQLASQGMNDNTLASLVAATPAHSILLLEDIDCAFPSREDEDDESTDDYEESSHGWAVDHSSVTLSGLLNVLDSVTSEEGKIVFATTNHVESLDPALIRAGRMDVKVEYKLATRHQIYQTYLRFFERRFISLDTRSAQGDHPVDSTHQRPTGLGSFPLDEVPLGEDEIDTFARSFADVIPEGTFSLAQIQGYLLTKKVEPRDAVEGAARWVEEQIAEKRNIENLKEQKRMKRMERKAASEAVARRLLQNKEAEEPATEAVKTFDG